MDTTPAQWRRSGLGLYGRSRRSQSEDSKHRNENNIVEDTLREIRSRRSSEESLGGGDFRRMSCEEIDNLLSDIRRSQTTWRPPPPGSAPPPLQEESVEEMSTLPFGGTCMQQQSKRRGVRKKRPEGHLEKKRRTSNSSNQEKQSSGHSRDFEPSSTTQVPHSNIDCETAREEQEDNATSKEGPSDETLKMVKRLKDKLKDMSEELDRVKIEAGVIRDRAEDVKKKIAEDEEDEYESSRQSERIFLKFKHQCCNFILLL